MCGIAGIVRWDGQRPDEGSIHAMCDAMVHRGPDDEGFFVGDGAALGMRRLSIIDLATVTSRSATRTARSGSSSTARSTTTRNCAHLDRRGHRSNGPRDTEDHRASLRRVRPALRRSPARHVRVCDLGYAAAGSCCSRATGWASSRSTTRKCNGGLVFASELKPLLQLPEARARSELGGRWSSLHLYCHASAPEHRRRCAEAGAGTRRDVGRDGRFARGARYWDVQFASRRSGDRSAI